MNKISTKSLLSRVSIEVSRGNVEVRRQWSGDWGMEVTILSTRPDFPFGVHMNFEGLTLSDAIDNAETAADLLGFLGEIRRADLELRALLLEHFDAACRRLGIEEEREVGDQRNVLKEGENHDS